jgi:hypothetical protein
VQQLSASLRPQHLHAYSLASSSAALALQIGAAESLLQRHGRGRPCLSIRRPPRRPPLAALAGEAAMMGKKMTPVQPSRAPPHGLTV